MNTGYVRPELVCPARTPASLRTAIDAGADAVYCGFQNETNARNFPGLNFTPRELETAIAYAHACDAKVLLAAIRFPRRADSICGARRWIPAPRSASMP